MPIAPAMGILKAAYDKQQDSLFWDMWLVQYAHMTPDSFTSFENFKNSALSSSQVKRSEEEILKDAENILNSTR